MDLAVAGAPPAFPAPLHVGRPNIGDTRQILDRLTDVLDRRWLTNGGRYVEAFERQVANRLNVRHCIATCNATSALQVVARATGLTGEVIVPSFTFVATAHALRWIGLQPVFCDVDPRSHTLDPEQVERLITSRTTGVVGVHLWGRGCEIEPLAHIAERHGLSLIFDAAQAFGCEAGGQLIGRFGDAEVFSFHATKVLNSFEGGAVTTEDDELAAKVRLLINFGFAAFDEVVALGTNAKMSEPAAVMGLASLESFDAFVAHNRWNHELYRELLAGLPGIELVDPDGGGRHHHHYVVVLVHEESPLSRDELFRVLWAEGVLARRYFYPGCHRMEPYRTEDPEAGDRLPNTERLCEQVLCLPTGTSVQPADVTTVCRLIHTAFARQDEIRKTLSGLSAEDGPPIW